MFGQPRTIPALGDGGVHYGMICDAAFTTYMLAQRVGHLGVTLPRAIQSLTSVTAQSVGLLDRDVLAPDYKADVNVIYIQRIKLQRPVVKADLPAGGKRLTQDSEGYVATVVSGAITYRERKSTGAMPGRLVRGEKARTAGRRGSAGSAPCPAAPNQPARQGARRRARAVSHLT